jgi:tetratricopeptide (TPR) repeat protein
LVLDPNWGEALHEKFLVLTALGDHAVIYSTVADALKHYQDANGVAARLAAISDSQADHDLLVSYYKLGRLSLVAAQLPEATSYYRNYLATAQRYAANPANPDGQRDLSIGYEILGDLSLRTDNVAAAIDYYKQDLNIVAQAAAARAGDKQVQRDLMVAYQRLGDATQKSGDFPAAIDLFSKSMNIAKTLAADLQDTQAQRELSVAYQRLGDANLAAGKPQDSLAQYRSYLEIAQRLAKADSDNKQAQRDLAEAYQRLGDASLLTNDLPGAIDTYQHYLRIAQRPAADPDNALVQHDLWSAHTRLGHALSRHGDTAQAIAELNAGQKIAAAQLAKNADFFDPYDKACYEALEVLEFSLQHPKPTGDERKTQQRLIDGVYSAVQSVLNQPGYDVAQIRREPDFSTVVGLPQFQALLDQAAQKPSGGE